MTQVVVTGAAGFIGSHLVAALAESGTHVRAIDNFDPFYPRTYKDRNVASWDRFETVEFVESDILGCSPSEFEAPVVVHLAARPGVRASRQFPELYERINAHGTRHICRMTAAAGTQKLVFASSSSVYGEIVNEADETATLSPISPYGLTKVQGEVAVHEWCESTGGQAAILRLFSVYGPRQRPDQAFSRFATLLAAGEPLPVLGDGTAMRDFTHVDDVVWAIRRAIDAGNPGSAEVFNIGTGKVLTIGDAIDAIAGAMGRLPEIERHEPHPLDPSRTCAKIRKAQEVLGYRPQVAIEEGIPLFVDWYTRTYGTTATR
ncbi:MAG: NAD-dependent epimerase/dehydratase family protein [Gemmatimonadales bacterium]